ncbi:MAG: DUF2284 domain-containing protein [Clostridia bacterium]|nr:DUF2284 domain-containing protein [Clostridia bacterium]
MMGHSEKQTMVARLPYGQWQGYGQERFEQLCRTCPHYGKNWGCPPFTAAVQTGGRDLELWARVVPVEGYPLSPKTFYEREWPRLWQELSRELLTREQEAGGLALLPGRCQWCALCQRAQGLACPTPERRRPSFEVLGLDAGRLMEEVFARPLLWGKGGQLPPYVTLLGGLLIERTAI